MVSKEASTHADKTNRPAGPAYPRSVAGMSDDVQVIARVTMRRRGAPSCGTGEAEAALGYRARWDELPLLPIPVPMDNAANTSYFHMCIGFREPCPS